MTKILASWARVARPVGPRVVSLVPERSLLYTAQYMGALAQEAREPLSVKVSS